MKAKKARRVTFSPKERARLAATWQELGTTFEEFVYHATLHALDEIDGDRRAGRLLDRLPRA